MFKGFKCLDNLSSLNFSQVAYKLPLKALLYRGVNSQRDNKKKIDFFEECRKSPEFWGFFLCLEIRKITSLVSKTKS